jgi:hypothetical protein
MTTALWLSSCRAGAAWQVEPAEIPPLWQLHCALEAPRETSLPQRLLCSGSLPSQKTFCFAGIRLYYARLFLGVGVLKYSEVERRRTPHIPGFRLCNVQLTAEQDPRKERVLFHKSLDCTGQRKLKTGSGS